MEIQQLGDGNVVDGERHPTDEMGSIGHILIFSWIVNDHTLQTVLWYVYSLCSRRGWSPTSPIH
jgi:hypothetical protein